MQVVLGWISGEVIICLKNVRIQNDILKFKCLSCAQDPFPVCLDLFLARYLLDFQFFLFAISMIPLDCIATCILLP